MTAPVEFNRDRLFRALGYTPSPGQQAFHRSRARFRVLIAGSRFGKSLAAAREVLPVVLEPETRTWIVGPTYALAEKEFRVVVADLQTLDSRIRFTTSSLSMSGNRGLIRLPWGAEVVTKSADRPDGLLGEEIDLLIVSEASRVPRDVWERFLRPRLATRMGRAIVPTTPAGADGWVYDLYCQGRDDAFPDVESFGPYASNENPHFPREDWESARRTLPVDVFDEQYRGRFVRHSGLVYPEFDRARHVVHCLPERWRERGVWRAVDFGYRNPFVCLWVTRDATGGWWVVDELYRTGLLVEDAAREIRNRLPGVPVLGTFADHDAEDRATLRRHGVPTQPADKAVSPGIAAVRSALNGRVRPGSDEREPELFVHARCERLIDEFDHYTWAQRAPGDRRNEPPRPHPYMDHALDALRYLLLSAQSHGRRIRAAGPARRGRAPGLERTDTDGGNR